PECAGHRGGAATDIGATTEARLLPLRDLAARRAGGEGPEGWCGSARLRLRAVGAWWVPMPMAKVGAMRVLEVNPGSSSVKLAVVAEDVALATVTVDEASAAAARGPLVELARRWAPIDAVGVRFVHGGDRAAPEAVGPAEI